MHILLEHMHMYLMLAQVRNEALSPLFTHATAGSGRTGDDTDTPGSAGSTGSTGLGRFNRVILLNDVFFCTSDPLRLLMLDQV